MADSNEVRLEPCDYRKPNCAAYGQTIGNRWICNNHICETLRRCWLSPRASVAAPKVAVACGVCKFHWDMIVMPGDKHNHNCPYFDAAPAPVAPSPKVEEMISASERLVTENPFEQTVERALLRAGHSYVTDHAGDNPTHLDFYLPAADVHIEVKTMHSERITEQMSRAANVIVAQGRGAIEWLAAQIHPTATPVTPPSDVARKAAAELERQQFLLADITPEEREQVAAIIAHHCSLIPTAEGDEDGESEHRALLRMCLQQFQFQYGKRKRGWDAKYLMDRLRAAVGEDRKEGEQDPAMDRVNAAAVAISEYLQAPPSTVGTIERLIARHCFPATAPVPVVEGEKKCIHCDPSFVPTGPDDWCECQCHKNDNEF